MNAIEALEAAGYKLLKNQMEYMSDGVTPAWDYPSDFFRRESDGAAIICEVTKIKVPVGYVVELQMLVLYKNWFVANDSDFMDEFVKDFEIVFEEYWQQVK